MVYQNIVDVITVYEGRIKGDVRGRPEKIWISWLDESRRPAEKYVS